MFVEDCVGRYVLFTEDFSAVICGGSLLEVMARATEAELKNCVINKVTKEKVCDHHFLCSFDEEEAERARGLSG